MTPSTGTRRPGPARAAGKAVDDSAKALTEVLEAVPFACAAFDRGTGVRVAANCRFDSDLGTLPGHAQRDALLATLYGEVTGEARGEEVRAPGSGRWYALHWRNLDCGGRALSLLTAVDISERIETLDSHKTQQEKLLFTSRMMSVGEMAATLAHELNQPLAAIVNYLNGSLRLVDQAGGPVQVERALQAARTQAEHASAVIARVREFVRAREPRRDAQDLPLIVDTVLELLRLEAERQQLRVELALAPQLPQVYADRVMVEQVLLNLVKNAIEAMREVPAAQRGLRIEARVNLDGDVEVRVCDRGPGLSQAESEQLFSPFYTTKSDGLGIGLAICRSIIEYHEGRLFFEARDGGGSVFGFTLPTPDRRI
ncbi:sensor histidine kinase [Luteimonas terrae]|uniref:histidine kinase n=1 Tax=Luteimonas terrae TaxID=1530191 RepID=A0ABU1Y301_9GAMM|nr:ATP-binding protein [Luteimonas terrae]MDR7194706.1 C4-dicarboxylate-specific signal transduction histidine kinase [Luteimonas terrae]